MSRAALRVVAGTGLEGPVLARKEGMELAMDEDPKNEEQSGSAAYAAVGLPIGVAIGMALGVAMDNLAGGLAIGVALGVASGGLATVLNKRKD